MRKIIPLLFAIIILVSGCALKDILSETTPKCVIEKGYDWGQKDFEKVILIDLNWSDFSKFSINNITIRYGYSRNMFEPFADYEAFVIAKSSGGKVLVKYLFEDPRYLEILCERCDGPSCRPCPEPELLKEGGTLFPFQYMAGMKTIEAHEENNPPLSHSVIARYLPENYTLDGKTLFLVDISQCMKRFCKEIADINDSDCRNV